MKHVSSEINNKTVRHFLQIDEQGFSYGSTFIWKSGKF